MNLIATAKQRLPLWSLLLFLLLQTVGMQAFAQDNQSNQLSGRVVDKTGVGLPGATVVVKGTTNGTTTDERGGFALKNVEPGRAVLVVSFVGYNTREVAVLASQRGKALEVNLDSDSKQIDEVIVTGVFDKRERMDASIAISTLSAAQIAVQVPNSAADLLKNVPGVYVNSAQGEIRSTVYSRGVSASSNNPTFGYYYVSMQEDGLPVTNATFASYGPDYFLRADATIGRLEAVRGGSAAITGPNSPGGIFNYVSKTGGETFGGEVRTKFGLEGNAQPFYRVDLNLGGKLNEKGDLTFNVGGFYRYSNGVRYPGYAMNFGGQGKFNVIKTYGKGSLKLYGKYLDDHNSYFEALPAVNFDKPQLAPGVSKYDTYLPNKSLVFDYPYNSPGESRNFDASKLIHSIDRAIGLDWQHNLGSGWSFQNNVKYTNKSRDWVSTSIVAPTSLDGIYGFAAVGALGRFGSYTYTDTQTGQVLATYTQSPKISGGQLVGFNITKTSGGDLPGNSVQPNSLLLSPLLANTLKVQEVLDQVSVTKKINDKLSATLGGYAGVSHIGYESGTAGITISTIENHPHPVAVTGVLSDGKTYQFTNAQGVAALGGGFNLYDYRQTQLSSFASITWKLMSALTFDGGLRYDNMRVVGSNQITALNTMAGSSTFGGVDGNPLTVYDNRYGVLGAGTFTPEHTFQTLSYSGALNYRLSPSLALYARYSDGKKAPDLNAFIPIDTKDKATFFDPQVQHIQQAEAGVKIQKERYSIFATPFYSLLSSVPSYVIAINADNTSYSTPTIYNSIETYGLELEGNVSITQHLSVRAVATVQKATATKWGSWITNNPGPQDDVVQDFSGNRAVNTPSTMFNVSPNYTSNHLTIYGNYRYMGKRAVNVANALDIPGFSQVDLGFGYNFTKSLSLLANVNNVFNTLGIMGFGPPGGFPNSINAEGFTAAARDANPNAVFSVSAIQPTAFYLTGIYKF